MTLTKPFFTVVSVATLLLFGGGVFLYVNLGSYAKPIVEGLLSDALGTDVSISSMDVNLGEKMVVIDGIRIANLPKYKKPNVMSVQRVGITLESFSKEMITFKDISIQKPEVFVEVTPNGTNLHDLKNNMPQAAAQPDSNTTAEKVKVIIKRFALTDTALRPSVTIVSEQDIEPVELDQIVLEGIGEKENGILAKDAARQIAEQLFAIFNQEAGEAGFLKGLSVDQIRDMGVRGVQGQVDAIKGKIDEKAGDLGNKINEGLGNLLGQ